LRGQAVFLRLRLVEDGSEILSAVLFVPVSVNVFFDGEPTVCALQKSAILSSASGCRTTNPTERGLTGADVRVVQDWLGHSNIQNTIVYIYLTSQSREEKARKFFFEAAQVLALCSDPDKRHPVQHKAGCVACRQALPIAFPPKLWKIRQPNRSTLTRIQPTS
jgi:hypothetical protein